MAKEKKKVTIDYGKINRDRFQNTRAIGFMLVLLSLVMFIQSGVTAETMKYIPILLIGVACVAYGFWGMKQLRKAMEEMEKNPQNKTTNR